MAKRITKVVKYGQIYGIGGQIQLRCSDRTGPKFAPWAGGGARERPGMWNTYGFIL